MLKLKMMYRDDVAAGRRRLHIKAVCQSVRSHHASGVDNAASPDWQTPLNIISPSERLITMQTTGRNPEVY